MKRPRLSLETVRLAEQLLARGRKHNAIAKQFGISIGTVEVISRGKHFQQCPERRAKYESRHVVATDPTPEQIVERCEAIRKRWKRQRVAFPVLSQL